MAPTIAQSPSSLVQSLPAMYQEDPFLGQFLLAFEKILLGRADAVELPPPGVGQGLEERIAGIASLFDPRQAPEEFLTWLASWTAFTLRADLDEVKRRDFVANIIPLYKKRGTKENLQDLLSIFTVGVPAVTEPGEEEFQVGVHSTLGEDTYVGGAPAHFFRVTVSLPRAAADVQLRQKAIAHALIELEKPAHTHYELQLEFPTMQIGWVDKDGRRRGHSTVGIDTLLGTITNS